MSMGNFIPIHQCQWNILIMIDCIKEFTIEVSTNHVNMCQVVIHKKMLGTYRPCIIILLMVCKSPTSSCHIDPNDLWDGILTWAESVYARA